MFLEVFCSSVMLCRSPFRGASATQGSQQPWIADVFLTVGCDEAVLTPERMNEHRHLVDESYPRVDQSPGAL